MFSEDGEVSVYDEYLLMCLRALATLSYDVPTHVGIVWPAHALVGMFQSSGVCVCVWGLWTSVPHSTHARGAV